MNLGRNETLISVEGSSSLHRRIMLSPLLIVDVSRLGVTEAGPSVGVQSRSMIVVRQEGGSV